MATEWHSLDTNQVLKKLNTDFKGLKSDETIGRLEQYGYNELVAAKKISPLRIFLLQFKSILILILLGATALSVLTGHVFDALVIFVIVIVSAIVGFSQEYRAEKALEALKNMLSSFALVIRDGVEMEALTAASVAALTIYDMGKSVDRGMTITKIYLESKKGGKSGTYQRK